jgi:8-oxo-dGTP pyrophosphatase MutT (NUDIX family)
VELNSDIVTTPPRAAATVVMLRDGAAGLEVFLIRRHGLSDVLGGAYVFPGGKLDDADATLDPARHLDRAPEALQVALGEPETHPRMAMALHVAAVREAFEESGVLFATDRSGRMAHPADHAAPSAGVPFGQWLERQQLRIASRELVPANKRFDTRFFVAALPPRQDARHDNFEATHSVWLTPLQAFERHRHGEVDLAPPQIMSLVHLAQHGSVASVLSEAGGRTPPCIQPEPFDEDGTRVICYPGDERHSVRERALPGPTRLRFRNQRFEGVPGYGLLPSD